MVVMAHVPAPQVADLKPAGHLCGVSSGGRAKGDVLLRLLVRRGWHAVAMGDSSCAATVVIAPPIRVAGGESEVASAGRLSDIAKRGIRLGDWVSTSIKNPYFRYIRNVLLT